MTLSPIELLKTEWIVYLQVVKKVSVHTLTAYERDWATIRNFFQTYFSSSIDVERFTTLTPLDLRAFYAHLHQNNLHARSAARCHAAFKSFIRFLIKKKYCQDHAIFYFKLARIQKKLPRPLKVEEVLSMIQNMEDEKFEPNQILRRRNKALLLLLYSTGLRIFEALSLKRADIQRDFLTIQGKGDKMRQVPLLASVKKALQDYLDLRQSFRSKENETDYLFLSRKGVAMRPFEAQKIFRLYRLQYGLPDHTTPHTMRHSCATHLVNHEANLRSVQELLGHASLSSTQLYVDVAENRLKSAFLKNHPRSHEKSL